MVYTELQANMVSILLTVQMSALLEFTVERL